MTTPGKWELKSTGKWLLDAAGRRKICGDCCDQCPPQIRVDLVGIDASVCGCIGSSSLSPRSYKLSDLHVDGSYIKTNPGLLPFNDVCTYLLASEIFINPAGWATFYSYSHVNDCSESQTTRLITELDIRVKINIKTNVVTFIDVWLVGACRVFLGNAITPVGHSISNILLCGISLDSTVNLADIGTATVTIL